MGTIELLRGRLSALPRRVLSAKRRRDNRENLNVWHGYRARACRLEVPVRSDNLDFKE